MDNLSNASEKSLERVEKITGKKVKLNLFDYESDMDIYNKVCIVEGFEGNWMSVEIISPAKNIRKLVAVSSIMSFEIIN